MNKVVLKSALFVGLALLTLPFSAQAKDIEYKNQEILITVTPREPTQIQFPAVIAGGFKPKSSALSLDRREADLVIFANDRLTDQGEAIIVRLQDGRSYSIRIKRASAEEPRDDVVRILDSRDSPLAASEEETLPYQEKKFDYAPPSQVSGLMREMILVAEFGKKNVPGYRVSEQYKGQTVLHDGTINAKIEKIFIGPNLWGYVISAENLLDQTQRVNPASFRIDGTRAISLKNWELAPRPLNIEEQISDKHNTKVYVITRAR